MTPNAEFQYKEMIFMADDRQVGACGGFFGNDVILWFIILFLLIFCCGFGFGGFGVGAI